MSASVWLECISDLQCVLFDDASAHPKRMVKDHMEDLQPRCGRSALQYRLLSTAFRVAETIDPLSLYVPGLPAQASQVKAISPRKQFDHEHLHMLVDAPTELR
jgi:hypothetical protein